MSNLTLVTPSKWLEYFIKDTFLGKFQIVTIYNGIDTNRFTIDYADNSEKSKKINILGAANVWDDRKGLKYFRQLAEDLGSDFHITLVGVDDSIDLPPNISKVDRLDGKQMVAYYNRADVFVNPTLGDNFPSVNVEAQLCGTPVITFDTGGSKESVCIQTGRIVAQGNYEELFSAITSMPPKNKFIATMTRNHALTFSVENMVDNYIKLYQELICCGS